MLTIPRRTWKYIALILTQALISLFGLGSNGIHSIVCYLPGHNTTIYFGLWQVCYRNLTDPFLSCDFVTSSHCSGFCNFFYVARVLVLLNTFVSLCLIGLFLNKIGVKQWVNGAGSLHCLFFATLQIFLTFATCLFLFYLFFHVRNVKAGLDERYVVSGFDATVGWCFMFPIGSFVLSLFVICVPAKEVFSKGTVTAPVVSSNGDGKSEEVLIDDEAYSKLQSSAVSTDKPAPTGGCNSAAQKLRLPEINHQNHQPKKINFLR